MEDEPSTLLLSIGSDLKCVEDNATVNIKFSNVNTADDLINDFCLMEDNSFETEDSGLGFYDISNFKILNKNGVSMDR